MEGRAFWLALFFVVRVWDARFFCIETAGDGPQSDSSGMISEKSVSPANKDFFNMCHQSPAVRALRGEGDFGSGLQKGERS